MSSSTTVANFTYGICIYYHYYKSSILDIEHYPYYIALGSTHNAKCFTEDQHSHNIIQPHKYADL